MVSEERDGLRIIRRRRFWLWSAILTAWPAASAANRLAGPAFGTATTVVWIIAIVYWGARTMFSRCPRCGGYFHWEACLPLIASNCFAQQCVRCGLRLRADRVIYPSME